MTPSELNDHLNGLYPDIKADTVNRVIYGDPMREMGADLTISVDDVVRAWIDGEKFAGSGYPLIVVKRAEYIDNTFPDIPVTHFPQTCTYRSITA